ncbi:ABC transporter permease subunit [Alphaproteobacteria bacterium HT1-32]|nr:ABC transporter permease subunit [Alphaproteobacteria bacterium HT1-32]
MTSRGVMKFFFGIYALMFFGYLFGPLIIMSISAFNSSSYPRVTPWECLTGEWFVKLANDARLVEGLQNSFLIGICVVLVAVPLGLAGAIMLTQIGNRVRSFYYTVVICPILVPGVVLGISTLIFWRRLGNMVGAEDGSFLFNDIFLTVLGQATFISAYCMLVFIARLQRFDPVQEEAALDLGATNVQAFTKVLLPFLKPAMGSAAVLAFLASFENYNTTVFTSQATSTLTMVLASKVRYGIDPSISALAVIIIGLTLAGAIIYEILRRREARIAAQRLVDGLDTGKPVQKAGFGALPQMAGIMILLVVVAGVATTVVASGYNAEACKAEIMQEKLRIQEKFAEEQRQLREERMKQQQNEAPAAPAQPKAASPFGNVFDPNNLGTQSGTSKPEPAAPAKPASPFGNVFDPNNLKKQSGDQ